MHIRDRQWDLTEIIRKMLFPRDPICIRFTDLTLSSQYSYSYFLLENDVNSSPFYWFDKFEPFKIRANQIAQSYHFEWFEFVKSVKRRTIDIIFEEKIGKDYWLESVKLVKRMHIGSRGNRIFRMLFVKSHWRSRITLTSLYFTSHYPNFNLIPLELNLEANFCLRQWPIV